MSLTPKQREKQRASQRLYHERQSRMPQDSRPRLSPKQNIPGPYQSVRPDEFTSMRTAVENPEDYPNDFRYLFRKANNPKGEPEYVWIDIDGLRKPQESFPSLYAATAYYHRRKWEDASW